MGEVSRTICGSHKMGEIHQIVWVELHKLDQRGELCLVDWMVRLH